MTPADDPQRQFLRHAVATLAYRGGKTLRDAPEGFGNFRLQKDSRTPIEILSHLGDLFDWAVALCRGQHVWQGPIADAFTHIGQIAMLRRLAGAPVRGENYFKADIQAGRVGPDQAVPRVEFD